MGTTLSRIESENLDNVSAFLMNAEEMDFPDGSFDLALSGFMGWDYCYDADGIHFAKSVSFVFATK